MLAASKKSVGTVGGYVRGSSAGREGGASRPNLSGLALCTLDCFLHSSWADLTGDAMGTKRKEPPQLKELCHDTLAEGVLVKHDGLPASWLAMFKAHPAAWAQLQEAVLAPNEHFYLYGRELTEESTAFVSWHSGPGPGVYDNGQFLAPAAALPKFLFLLLQARLKILHWLPKRELRHDRDGTGGYSFAFRRPGEVVKVWKEICYYLPDEDHSPHADSSDWLGDAADKAMLDIFLALSYEDSKEDLVDVLAAKLSLDPVEVAAHIETTIRSNRDVVEDVITEALYDPDLLRRVVREIDMDLEKDNREANYFRAPALSLHFDFSCWRDVRPR